MGHITLKLHRIHLAELREELFTCIIRTASNIHVTQKYVIIYYVIYSTERNSCSQLQTESRELRS